MTDLANLKSVSYGGRLFPSLAKAAAYAATELLPDASGFDPDETPASAAAYIVQLALETGVEVPVLVPDTFIPIAVWEDALRAAVAARVTAYLKHDPRRMAAAAINRELDALYKKASKVGQKLIDAGRGHETFTDIMPKTDPLSLEHNAIWDRRRTLQWEIRRRMGPGHETRLPRGFGPLKR